MNDMIKLELPLETYNAILIALSKFAYVEAQPHIDLIKSQGDSQALEQAEEQPKLDWE
jgi:hypothetical protein